MPVKREYQASDLAKRLKILEGQLYGKKLDVRSQGLEKEVGSSKLDQTSNFQSQSLPSNIKHPPPTSDIAFLKQDLIKILIFSSLAVGIQITLFLLQIPNKLKF